MIQLSAISQTFQIVIIWGEMLGHIFPNHSMLQTQIPNPHTIPLLWKRPLSSFFNPPTVHLDRETSSSFEPQSCTISSVVSNFLTASPQTFSPPHLTFRAPGLTYHLSSRYLSLENINKLCFLEQFYIHWEKKRTNNKMFPCSSFLYLGSPVSNSHIVHFFKLMNQYDI